MTAHRTVPVEPTEEMINAGVEAYYRGSTVDMLRSTIYMIIRSGIKAAPPDELEVVLRAIPARSTPLDQHGG